MWWRSKDGAMRDWVWMETLAEAVLLRQVTHALTVNDRY